ncbi:M23 family metallopeptidase [Trichocoleus desertorum AS-A10]|uniref:M23 family metallopeptidase n=1 Tax=Trichocoleus desertorum TaxID=1481672 RepID=UPI0032994BA6
MTQQAPLPKYLDEAELEAAIHGIAKHHAERTQAFFLLLLLLLGVWGMWLRSHPIKLTPQSAKLEHVEPAPQKLAYPVDAPITSGFGTRKHPITGQTKLHAGVDFGAPSGYPIRAAAAGKVTFAGWMSGYGNTIEIDHGNQRKTLYAHASSLYAKVGQQVQPGQAIAAVGSTGNSTGPHLHFEVTEKGQVVDPMKYLDKSNDTKPVGTKGKK